MRKISTLADLKLAARRGVVSVECPEIDAVLYVASPTAGLVVLAQEAMETAGDKEAAARAFARTLVAGSLVDEHGSPLEGDVSEAVHGLPPQTYGRLVDACKAWLDQDLKKSPPSGAEVPVQTGEGPRTDGGGAGA